MQIRRIMLLSSVLAASLTPTVCARPGLLFHALDLPRQMGLQRNFFGATSLAQLPAGTENKIGFPLVFLLNCHFSQRCHYHIAAPSAPEYEYCNEYRNVWLYGRRKRYDRGDLH